MTHDLLLPSPEPNPTGQLKMFFLTQTSSTYRKFGHESLQGQEKFARVSMSSPLLKEVLA